MGSSYLANGSAEGSNGERAQERERERERDRDSELAHCESQRNRVAAVSRQRRRNAKTRTTASSVSSTATCLLVVEHARLSIEPCLSLIAWSTITIVAFAPFGIVGFQFRLRRSGRLADTIDCPRHCVLLSSQCHDFIEHTHIYTHRYTSTRIRAIIRNHYSPFHALNAA